MITFNFHRTHTLLGKLIRFFSGGMVNHVSVKIGEYIWEALFSIKIVNRRLKIIARVIKTHESEWDKDYQVVKKYNVETCYESTIVYWLDKQVGKKYDWRGVLSFIFPNLKEKKDRWNCSEMGTVVLAKALNMASGTYNKRQSPQGLFDILQFRE